MTSEAVYLKPNGQVKNSGPLDYKIPGVRNIPRKLNVTLLKDNRFKKSLYSAKVCSRLLSYFDKTLIIGALL